VALFVCAYYPTSGGKESEFLIDKLLVDYRDGFLKKTGLAPWEFKSLF